MIPEHMRNTLDNWVNYGTPAPCEMGSFFRAILQHDLMAAAMFADDTNRPRLADWAIHLYNEVPALAHGSAERLEEWHRRGGLIGRQSGALEDVSAEELIATGAG